MNITKNITDKYKYIFLFDFDMEKLAFCRGLKAKYGYKTFGFNAKAWRFNDVSIANEIQKEFPEVTISASMFDDFELDKAEKKQDEIREKRAIELKNAKDSSIVINNVKGKLYPYQKVGVEFFINNGGKAILSDQMGCLSGKTEIKVNKGGNCRTYRMEQAYRRFNGLDIKNKNWKLKSKTRSLNEKTGMFELNEIKKILYKGEKETIKIKTNSGKELILTADHKILSEKSEWIESGEFKVGDKILVNGKQCPKIEKIIEITKVGKEKVYDIVMDDPHRNFIANGIIVHNCGKSLQALAYVAHTKQQKTLVVCPSSVKYAWESEVKKWTKLKSFVIDSKSKLTDKLFNEHDIFIINYDIVKKHFEFIHNKRFDVAIVDEVQYIKNSAAQRTKFVKAIVKRCESILLLSGTPMMSRPVELFNGLNLIDPRMWNDWYGYTKRYCDGKQGIFGYEYKGASNIEELQRKIGKYFLRRTKDQVLKELPPKTFVNIPTVLDTKTKSQYNLAEKNLVAYLKDVKDKKNHEIRKSMQAEKLIKLNELRQLTTKGKITTAKNMITDIIEAGEKVVVFSVYTQPLEELFEEFKDKAVILTGKSNDIQKKEAIEKFQEDDSVSVFFGGMISAGAGITLTAASNVLSIDFSWTPGDHQQSHDRIHRPGQKAKKVTIYQLFAKDTIDEYMTDLLAEKQKLFDVIIEGKDVSASNDSSFSMINDVLKHLESK